MYGVTIAAVTVPNWQQIDTAYRQSGFTTLSHRTAPVKANSPIALALALKALKLCHVTLLTDCKDSSVLLRFSSLGILVVEGELVFLSGYLDTWLEVVQSLRQPADNDFCRLVSKIIILLEINGFRPVLIRYKKKAFCDGIFCIEKG